MAKRKHATQAEAAGLKFVSSSVEETLAFGERIGRVLQAGDVLGLIGELGSGKTTLIQGIARGLGIDEASVKSPTFILLREYPGRIPLVHVDGYRLEGSFDATWLDLEWVFSPRKITVIEWADRFEGLLPEGYLELRLSHAASQKRKVAVLPHGEAAKATLSRLSGEAVHAAGD